MTHVIAIVMVLGLSGMPAGILFCGLSCAPEEATAPSCHEHGSTADAGPIIEGVHLCDQDASSAPMIASAGVATAGADAAAPALRPRLSLSKGVAFTRPPEFPPGARSCPLDATHAILRI